jgi:hypothetical protein
MDVHDSDMVWQQTLCLLRSINESSSNSPCVSQSRVVCKAKAKRGRPPKCKSKVVDQSTSTVERKWNAAAVTNIEPRSDKTIAVCWADATSGHYCEQLWVMGVARRGAVCALTGDIIRHGNAVYRPRVTESNVPSNAEAMILVASLKRRYPEQAASSAIPSAAIASFASSA